MNMPARSIISGAVLGGLLAFLGCAIATQGLASDAALVGFSFIAMHGLVEIAIVSYAPSPGSRGRMKMAFAPSRLAAAPQRRPVASIRPAVRRARSRALVA